MRTRFFSAITVVVSLFVAAPLPAATLIAPTDQQLRDRAEAIVIGRVIRVDDRAGGEMPMTSVFLAVEEVVKGVLVAGEEIELREFGGLGGSARLMIPGSAEYREGERVLAFVTRREDGTWFTTNMALGKWTERHEDGVRVFMRDESELLQPTGARPATESLRYLRGDATAPAMATWKGNLPIQPAAAPSSFTLRDGSNAPFRWREFDLGQSVTFELFGTQAGQADTAGSTDTALNAWNSAEPTDISLSRSPVPAAGPPKDLDGKHTIAFDTTLPNSGFCDGGLACTLLWTDNADLDGDGLPGHSKSGEMFNNIIDADIYIAPNSTLTSKFFEEMLTHELGHALAFRHSNVGDPQDFSAVMNSSIGGFYGANLQDWDIEAAQTVYGPGPACVPIKIISHPQSTTVGFGQPAALTVEASGSDPVYQWYLGDSPDPSQAIKDATKKTYLTPPITSEKHFWVGVTNSCTPGGVNSNTAIVSVCTLPVITEHPQSQSVSPGGNVTLTVKAVGTGTLNYEWYEGQTGDVSRRRFESSTHTFTSGPLATSTSFWVRVRDGCGHADSAAAVITVGTCPKPTFTVQPANQSATAGQSVRLTAQATGQTPITYQWFEGNAGDTTKPVPGATSNTFDTPPLAKTTRYWVRATNSCGSTDSAAALITVSCVLIAEPVLSAQPIVLSGEPYQVTITNPLATQHEIQESLSKNPAAPMTTVNGTVAEFVHSVGTATRYYYRARSVSACNGEKSPFSPWIEVVVTPLPSPNDREPHVSVSNTRTTPVSFQIFVPAVQSGKNALNTSFTAATNKPWLTVTPPSGTIPPGGTNLTVTANPASLPPGTSTGNVTVTNSSNGQTISNTPVSVSRVSPVSAGTRSAPPNDALIFPVAHTAGSGGSSFETDIRLMNRSDRAVEYQLTFTASGVSGTLSGLRSLITVPAGDSIALDDVVKAFFGQGAVAGENVTGVLEVRPLSAASTIGSTRTFNLTPAGTFGEALRAIPFGRFVAKQASGPRRVLNLQQIAQSAAFRTNLGLVEAAGEPATVAVRAFGADGAKLDEFIVNLLASEHQQINRVLALRGPSVANAARLEIEPLSATGRVTAYVSVVDQVTNDAMIIDAVEVGAVAANRYVLPGITRTTEPMAELYGWQSDVRIFNSSTSPVTATLIFYPAGVPGGPLTREVSVAGGEVKMLNDVLLQTFGVGHGEGALHVVTPSPMNLHVTAHTFTDRFDGKRGHFVGALTASDGIGVGDRPFTILHLEESPQYGADVVVAELTGSPAVIEVSGTVVDSKVEAKAQVPLQPFEYTSLRSLLVNLGLGSASDARVSVRVVSGSGRIFALGVLTDKRSSDTSTIEGQ